MTGTPRCPVCERAFKDVPAHMRRIHPEAFYMSAAEPAPHPMAQRITIVDHSYTREGSEVTFGEWKDERYTFPQYGWFVPVARANPLHPLPDPTPATEVKP